MEPMLGSILFFGGNYAPRDWANCWGQLIEIAVNSALFALLGTFYGGDGRVTFGLPDLRGRVIIGSGSGPGRTPRSVGQIGGYESIILSNGQMPSHDHSATLEGSSVTIKVSTADGTKSKVEGRNTTLAAVTGGAFMYNNATPDTNLNVGSDALSGTITIGASGGSQAHENMPPWQAITALIALQGYFPSRS